MYNALESLQAFDMGKTQKKERDREFAMKGVGNALASGDYASGAAQAFAIDPMYGMQIQQYSDGRNALATRREIGGMIGSGDRKGAAAKAYGAGELEIGAQIDAQIAQMTQQQRDNALFLAGQMGNAAMTLQGITDPEQRMAQWQQMQSRFVNEFGIDPAALAQFNPLDDASLEDAMGQAQSFSDRLQGRRWQMGFDRDGEYQAQQQQNWEAEFGLREAEANANDGAGAYGLNLTWGTDAQGNYVPMQPSKSGGLIRSQVPDGITPLGPYGTAFDRAIGTKAAEAEGDRNPALVGVEATEADMARLSEQIDLAIGQTNKDNTGFWGQYNITATDLAATLKTIRASGAFTSLVNLKAQGGTLGALSDTELQLLEAKIANVERSQSEEQLDRNLLELKNALQGSATLIRATYEKEYAAGRYRPSNSNLGGANRVVQQPTGPLSGGGNSTADVDALVNMYLPQ